MRLTRIMARDFVSYEEVDLDLSAVDMAVIVGSNGAGKSTLYDAVTWCLYGKCRASLLDSVVRRKPEQQDGCLVRVEFTANGHEVAVERERVSRGRGRTTLRLWVDGEDKTRFVKGTGKDVDVDRTQAAVNRCVGLGYEALSAGPFMRQNESGAFMALKPTARRELLLRVFELERYVPWHEAAKVKAREAETAAASLAALVGMDERALEGAAAVAHELDGARAALAAAEVEAQRWQASYDAAKVAVEGLRARQTDVAALLSEQGRVEAEVAQVDSDVRYATGRVGRAAAALENLPTEPPVASVTDLAAELEAARAADAETSAIDRELAVLDAKMGVHHVATCPSCSTTFECAGGVDVAALRKEHRALERRRDKVTASRRATPVVEAEHRAAARAWTEWDKVVDARDALESFATMRDAAMARMEAVRARLADVTALVTEREAEREALAEAQGVLSAVSAGLDQRKALVSRAAREVGVAEERERAMMETDLRLSANRRALEAAEARAGGFRVLAAAFHVTGIPGAIMSAGLGLIEERANEVLERLPGGFTVSLLTEREKRTGGVMDTLEPVVLSDGVELEYEMLSGAERFRVDLAMRMGFSAVLATRAGSGVRLETLFLDEPLAPVDAAGREAVVDALGVAGPEFPLMLVVSHHPDFDDRVPTRIEVTKDEEGVSSAHVR